MIKNIHEIGNRLSLWPLHIKGSGSERGVALVLVLVLSTIGIDRHDHGALCDYHGNPDLGQGKKISYCHEAAMGCVDVVRKIIQDQAATTIAGIPMAYPDVATFTAKLDPANTLASYNTLVTIDPGDPDTYDLTIDVGNPVYRCYAKMIQKQQGNTNRGYKYVRTKAGVVPADQGMGVVNFTYYTFSIVSQKATNPDERVKIELVHIF